MVIPSQIAICIIVRRPAEDVDKDEVEVEEVKLQHKLLHVKNAHHKNLPTKVSYFNEISFFYHYLQLLQ